MVCNVQIKIELMKDGDWPGVREIYAEGIASGIATFEKYLPNKETWDASHLEEGRLVAKKRNQIVGWAALSPVSSRFVYKGVAEASVYVGGSFRGEGVGKELLNALIRASEDARIWTLESSMFPENVASIRLHESCGFRKVGFRERIGELDGKWRDTILMERRSEGL
jgi:phosphinothricin acetyltransferase